MSTTTRWGLYVLLHNSYKSVKYIFQYLFFWKYVNCSLYFCERYLHSIDSVCLAIKSTFTLVKHAKMTRILLLEGAYNVWNYRNTVDFIANHHCNENDFHQIADFCLRCVSKIPKPSKNCPNYCITAQKIVKYRNIVRLSTFTLTNNTSIMCRSNGSAPIPQGSNKKCVW